MAYTLGDCQDDSLPLSSGWDVRLTDATISINSSPSRGFLTLTSSIFHPPLAKVSRQTMAFPLLDDMLQRG